MQQIIPVDPFDYVVIGGTGDLALRKLFPALMLREEDGQLPLEARIIGAATGALSRQDFTALVKARAQQHLGKRFTSTCWEKFKERLDYQQICAGKQSCFDALRAKLDAKPDRIRVFYLSTAPHLYGQITQNLEQSGLNCPRCRIVLEKPIGHDHASFCAIDNQVRAHFSEPQIFRIDHYLGKETVQSLSALRFANILFEPLWNRHYIDHVQITTAETVGLGKRAGYYDNYGALRDMVQNHLLQLLCLAAMEPPSHLDQDSLRDEKLKVLRALRPITPESLHDDFVFGQYRAGSNDNALMPGYTEELGKESRTDTFVALKCFVENNRWAGVPFYLRTGKRMPQKRAEIVIRFRDIPHSVFDASITKGQLRANRLVLRLQPDEGVELELMTKDPGPGGMRLRSMPLDLSFEDAFNINYPDAYERLLLDVVRGNSSLFMRRDEVEAAWLWTAPLLEYMAQPDFRPAAYKAGSWGPEEAGWLMRRDKRRWREDQH